ncbi:hypothetical protein HYX08_03215 [Candidatus Woesearchaeota archaeon]|nr:hypothetical protein [Candidatus Woesearchaeota archaeon]
MKRLTVKINDIILNNFKETAKEKFGNEKGSLSKAIDEALRSWIKEHKTHLTV